MLAGQAPRRAGSASNRAAREVGKDRAVGSGNGALGTGDTATDTAAAVGHEAAGADTARPSRVGAYRDASATPSRSEPAPIAFSTLFVLARTTACGLSHSGGVEGRDPPFAQACRRRVT